MAQRKEMHIQSDERSTSGQPPPPPLRRGQMDLQGTLQAESHSDSQPLLAVEDLTVRIGNRVLLGGVNFTVKPGEFCGLIGENGAGKTTLLRTLVGLQPAPRGRVLVEGQPPNKARCLVGYVPQKINFAPDLPLRVCDLVELGCDGHRLGPRLFSRRLRGQVDAAIHAVGAEKFARQRVGELSGGQQQRAVIAHAMARRPRLLLLDEPLANLDFRSANELARLLGHLARVHCTAVLVTAHDMNPLLSLLDRIVYLAEGRVACGTVDEVIQTDSLSRLYGYPVEVIRQSGRVLVLPTANPSKIPEDRCYVTPGDEQTDGDPAC
jgi:zinc/manganese transport system ATP-binding protein